MKGEGRLEQSTQSKNDRRTSILSSLGHLTGPQGTQFIRALIFKCVAARFPTISTEIDSHCSLRAMFCDTKAHKCPFVRQIECVAIEQRASTTNQLLSTNFQMFFVHCNGYHCDVMCNVSGSIAHTQKFIYIYKMDGAQIFCR